MISIVCRLYPHDHYHYPLPLSVPLSLSSDFALAIPSLRPTSATSSSREGGRNQATASNDNHQQHPKTVCPLSQHCDMIRYQRPHDVHGIDAGGASSDRDGGPGFLGQFISGNDGQFGARVYVRLCMLSGRDIVPKKLSCTGRLQEAAQ